MARSLASPKVVTNGNRLVFGHCQNLVVPHYSSQPKIYPIEYLNVQMQRAVFIDVDDLSNNFVLFNSRLGIGARTRDVGSMVTQIFYFDASTNGLLLAKNVLVRGK